jgi:ABC-type multidrug transport system fused ATPase/permease subunit
VPQRPTLLTGTVAENIRMGDASVPDEEVRRAARLAAAEGFIGGLPHGYETTIGGGGRPLSAGERRRLALARAFLRDAPFLILDEPTADLDSETSALVAEALENQRHRRTVLLIAHRPEILTGADRVVALESGRLEAVERPAAVVAAA